ncbi:MAG: serine/threonine protein kinase [Candidatus Obscuribacterales bacterium]|nr:serine/threonine protein kinase [Candidatus Obscuribacterales bacterium]
MNLPENSKAEIIPAGTVIAKNYEIKGVIRSTLNSCVYAARHLTMSTDVALKVLNGRDLISDEKRILRFQQESKALAGLKHPNIVKALSSGFLDDGRPFLVMELIKGESLRDFLNREGRCSLLLFKEIFSQVLSGLEFAHQAKIIHRDIKPENILLEKSIDNQLTAKLSDFGIAKNLEAEATEQSLTATNEIIGSPAYMSPEQCEKKALNESSDIYSLGCVMYESLYGRAPHISDSPTGLMYKHLHEEASLPSGHEQIPSSYRTLIHRCLKKDPKQRWESCEALRAELENLELRTRAPRKKLVGILLAVLIPLLIIPAFMLIRAAQQATHKPKPIPKKSKIVKTFNGYLFLPMEERFENLFASLNARNTDDSLKMLSLLERADDLKDKSQVENCYAFLYLSLHDYQNALKHARIAKTLALKYKPPRAGKKFFRAYDDPCLKELDCLIALKRLPEAKNLLEEQETHRKDADSPAELYGLYQLKSKYLIESGKYEESAKFCSGILKMESLDPNLRMLLQIELLKCFALIGDQKRLDQATGELESSFRSYERELSADAKSTIVVLAVEPFLLARNLEKSQQYMRIAADRQAHIGKTTRTHSVLHIEFQAIIYLLQGKLKHAEQKFLDCLALKAEAQDKEVLSDYLNLAYIGFKTSNSQLADHYLEEALMLDDEKWSSCSASTQLPELEIFLAEKLKHGTNFSGARRCLKQALSLPQITEAQKQEAKTLLNSLP